MRKNLGLKNNIKENDLRNLKDGDLLYSAVYDNGFETTSVEPFIFRGYVKAPKNQKGIWAKYVNVAYYDEATKKPIPATRTNKVAGKEEEVEDIKVNDISVGLFLNPKDALKAFMDFTYKMYASAKDAYEKEENK